MPRLHAIHQSLPRAAVPTVIALVLLTLLSGACGSSGAELVRIEAPPGAPTSAGNSSGSAAPAGRSNERGPIVFLDPGHGGSDPGWGTAYQIANAPLEKDLTLDLAKRTGAYLEADGFRVVYSRTEDIDLNRPPRDVNGDGCVDDIDEVQARVDAANASGAAVLLSIHFNGLPGTQLSGSATFYNAVREFGADNKRLAEMIQAAQLDVLAGFGHKARDWNALRDDALDGPSQSKCPTGYKYYTLLGPAAAGRPRPSQMPGAIAEAMFLTFPTEAELAARPEVRDALAKAYATVLKEFLAHDRSQSIAPAGATQVSAALSGPATLIDRGAANRKEIALTFDAGAGAGFTGAILDLLAQKGIKGTFGLTGQWCDANAALARRIAVDGHAVLNHTNSHASWTGRSPGSKPLSAEQRRDEVQRAEQAIERATGVTGRPFFRSPYGDEDASVQRDIAALGYRYNVLWTFDTKAWKGAKAEEIVSKGTKAIAPGAIYVFHVTEQQDMLALERLIDAIRAAGYGFVTVPQMLTAQ